MQKVVNNMKKNLVKMVEGLFQKVDLNKERYQGVLEKRQQELIELGVTIQDEQTKLKEYHKMVLLNQVTQEVYDEQKAVVQKIQEKYNDIQREMGLISEYEREDALALIEEIESRKGELSADRQQEVKKIQMKLLAKKLEYLEAMQQAKAEYDALIKYDVMFQDLKVAMGLQVRSYVSGSHSALNMVSVGEGYEHLLIENVDVYNVLEYGRISPSLQKVVTEAKEKGIIE